MLAWPARGIHCASLAVGDHNSHRADTRRLNTMHHLELLDQGCARTWDTTWLSRLRRSTVAWRWHGNDFLAGVVTHSSHRADMHRLNTMHHLELLDQGFARTWDKTWLSRLRRSTAAWRWHGNDFLAGVVTHSSHRADMHRLNTMHHLELLDQGFARTWDKTWLSRLRRSTAAWRWHGNDFLAGVVTHSSHMVDMHTLNTMHPFELLNQELPRTWDKTLPCRLRRSSAAWLWHGSDFLAGVADRTLDTAGNHCVHCMLDTTKVASAGRGTLFSVGGARHNLRCKVDMHTWHTKCLPPRCSVEGRHSYHSFPCISDTTTLTSALHGGMTFEGVVAHNRHCKGEMHRQCTKSLELHLHARVEHTLRKSWVPALALPRTHGKLRFESLHCSSLGATHWWLCCNCCTNPVLQLRSLGRRHTSCSVLFGVLYFFFFAWSLPG